jgi:hypothetical protein
MLSRSSKVCSTIRSFSAELILHGRYRTIDLSAFRFSRFAEDDLVIERNVF